MGESFETLDHSGNSGPVAVKCYRGSTWATPGREHWEALCPQCWAPTAVCAPPLVCMEDTAPLGGVRRAPAVPPHPSHRHSWPTWLSSTDLRAQRPLLPVPWTCNQEPYQPTDTERSLVQLKLHIQMCRSSRQWCPLLSCSDSFACCFWGGEKGSGVCHGWLRC